MATPAEMITSIETTLASLYTKTSSSLSQKDRASTIQDIQKLEESLEYWRGRASASTTAGGNGSRPRCASVDLSGFC